MAVLTVSFAHNSMDAQINKKEPLVEAVVEAAKVYLKDVKVFDVSACHRPFSADDRLLLSENQQLFFPLGHAKSSS
eukprot:scaffold12478_cov84-Skeletonema_dohrnii-CCMP3373.AAC.2